MILLDETLKLIKQCELPRRELARQSGVGYEWLCKIDQGRIKDPGVKRVQTLYNFLVNR